MVIFKPRIEKYIIIRGDNIFSKVNKEFPPSGQLYHLSVLLRDCQTLSQYEAPHEKNTEALEIERPTLVKTLGIDDCKKQVGGGGAAGYLNGEIPAPSDFFPIIRKSERGLETCNENKVQQSGFAFDTVSQI